MKLIYYTTKGTQSLNESSFFEVIIPKMYCEEQAKVNFILKDQQLGIKATKRWKGWRI